MSVFTRAGLIRAIPATALFSTALLTELSAAAQATSSGDIDILQSAIPLERAGIKAYQDAAATGLLSAGVLQVATGFMTDHMAHRDALIGAVKAAGATPTDETTKLTYPSLKTQADILAFAQSVEQQAAAAYLATFTKLQDRNLARVAASILGVETMHAGILAAVLQKAPPYRGFVS